MHLTFFFPLWAYFFIFSYLAMIVRFFSPDMYCCITNCPEIEWFKITTITYFAHTFSIWQVWWERLSSAQGSFSWGPRDLFPLRLMKPHLATYWLLSGRSDKTEDWGTCLLLDMRLHMVWASDSLGSKDEHPKTEPGRKLRCLLWLVYKVT